MCPHPPGDESSAHDDAGLVDQVSHHLLFALDPFRAPESKRPALRWLAALTSDVLLGLARDPEWAAVRVLLQRAADRWLERVDAEEDAEEREPWQASAPSTGAVPPRETRGTTAGQEAPAERSGSARPEGSGAAGIALHVHSLRELMIDDYDRTPHVLPPADTGERVAASCGRPDTYDVRAGAIATATGVPRDVVPDGDVGAQLPWCLTNHATWLVTLADRFPDRPGVARRYLFECLARPGIARAVPTRLARVAVAVCEERVDRWALLDRVIGVVEASLAELPPIDVVPADALHDVVLAVRAPVAQAIRTAEVTEPRLVCVAELLGIVRLLRHASALDVRAAYEMGRRDADAAVSAMRALTSANELQFERVFTAVLQQPSSARLLAVAGRAGAEALRYTRHRYDEWRARTGQLGVIPSDGRSL